MDERKLENLQMVLAAGLSSMVKIIKEKNPNVEAMPDYTKWHEFNAAASGVIIDRLFEAMEADTDGIETIGEAINDAIEHFNTLQAE